MKNGRVLNKRRRGDVLMVVNKEEVLSAPSNQRWG